MKPCRACGLTKPLGEFYRHKMMADGRLNFCMDCVRKRVACHREKNVERIRAYDRGRGFRVYSPRKVRVRAIVTLAVRRGDLQPRPCERCDAAIKIHAHHEDYRKPLDVTWLCTKCHGERHREINAERRIQTALSAARTRHGGIAA